MGYNGAHMVINFEILIDFLSLSIMKGQNIKNLHPFSYFINKRGIPRIVFFSKKLYAVACENSHETAANQHVSKAKTPTASQPKTSLGFHADYRDLEI